MPYVEPDNINVETQKNENYGEHCPSYPSHICDAEKPCAQCIYWDDGL